jgi:hypothetical protein
MAERLAMHGAIASPKVIEIPPRSGQGYSGLTR